MNNRMALLREVDANYQAGVTSFRANDFAQALVGFTKAKDLLETIPESERGDHENRELGRNCYNMALSLQMRVNMDTPDDHKRSVAIEDQCIANYKKSEGFYAKIVNQIPGDADRIKRTEDGLRMAVAVVNSANALTKFSEVLEEIADAIALDEADEILETSSSLRP